VLPSPGLFSRSVVDVLKWTEDCVERVRGGWDHPELVIIGRSNGPPPGFEDSGAEKGGVAEFPVWLMSATITTFECRILRRCLKEELKVVEGCVG